MRSIWVVCVLSVSLLTACASHRIKCDRHLTPINTLKRPIANAPARALAKEASREVRNTAPAEATP